MEKHCQEAARGVPTGEDNSGYPFFWKQCEKVCGEEGGTNDKLSGGATIWRDATLEILNWQRICMPLLDMISRLWYR